MTATLLASAHGGEVWHATWAELADEVEARGGCGCLAVDPPFSSRTYKGHEEGRLIAKRAKAFGDSLDAKTSDQRARKRYEQKGRAERRSIDYAAWSDVDMIRFLRRWVPLTRGWVCVLTDHVLAVVVEAELEAQDRVTFPPIPCIDPGGRVRFAGDGPSSNTVWLVVARPRGAPYHKWGTLRGEYRPPPGYNDRGQALRDRLPGAKTDWLMQSIIDDYSRAGDLIADPCCGGGTSLRAAVSVGRRAIGGDMARDSADKAAEILVKPLQALLIRPRVPKAPPEPSRQASLFEGSK